MADIEAGQEVDHVQRFVSDIVFLEITRELEDDSMTALKKLLTASGRGRRKAVSSLCDNHLLSQLYVLRIQCQLPWSKVTEWLSKMYPAYHGDWQNLVQQTWNKLIMLPDPTSRCGFYQCVVEMDNIGPYCTDAGIFHSTVSSPLSPLSPELITRGVALELNQNIVNVPGVLQLLCPGSFEPGLVRNRIAAIVKVSRKLSKTKSKAAELARYLSIPLLDLGVPVKANDSVSNQAAREDIVPVPKDNILRLRKLEGNISSLNDKTKELQEINDVLTEECRVKSGKINLLESDLECTRVVLAKTMDSENVLTAVICELETKCLLVQQELSDVKNSKLHIQNIRRAKYLNSEKICKMDRALESNNHKDKLNRIEKELRSTKVKLSVAKVRSKSYVATISQLRKELIELKLKCSVYDRLVNSSKKKVERLESECAKLNEEVTRLESSNRLGGIELRKGNQFTPRCEGLFMEMSGQLDVPLGNCSKVVQAFYRWLYDIEIPLTDLPSAATVGNFLDRAQFLSTYQVGEELDAAKRYDLHGDGTTRDHKKIIGNQITLDSGKTLSMGFKPVATEDSNTLLDNVISLLEEISEVYGDDEQQSVYKNILSKMFASMTDRASVNKCFHNKLLDYMKEELGSDCELHFLYCNAHFLLGLSKMADEVINSDIKSKEAENGTKLGRDAFDKFKRFQGAGESAPSRFVRTACDVLGPRGDEKNGCKRDWEVYCEQKGVKSHVKSFRMNRFNNFFEGAASLYHHLEHIQDFLGNFRDGRNLKLDSVLLDSKSAQLQAYVRALGIVYAKVSGPFWNLLHSNTNYCDLHIYIQKMFSKFKEWSNDSTELLKEDDDGIFSEFGVKKNEAVSSVLGSGQTEEKITLEILQKIMSGFVTVTERQLEDFLSAGKYGKAASPELREKMSHCKLTNLISEYEFGDLDFSQFRRRNASLHFHSGVQMIKRNRTLSDWLYKKEENERCRLLDKARKGGAKLRKKHIEYEANVRSKIKAKLCEINKKLHEKEAAKAQQNLKIVEALKPDGPCLTPGDVDALVTRYSSKSETQLKEKLKCQIRYLKSVVGIKDRHLVFGKKNSEELKNDIKSVLGLANPNLSENGTVENVHFESETVVKSEGNIKKRKKDDQPSTNKKQKCNSGKEVCTVNKTQCISEKENTNSLFENFRYTCEGEYVAVAYENDYFVGTVVEIKDDLTATIQFLTSTIDNMYKWPRVDDIALVNAEFVFASNFEVVKSRPNSRTFKIPELDYLEDLYREFKGIYFKDDDL